MLSKTIGVMSVQCVMVADNGECKVECACTGTMYFIILYHNKALD